MLLLRHFDHVATRAVVAVIGICAFSGLTQARDSAQIRRDDLKTWIDGLTDQAGANCCSDADGAPPEEVDWDMGANHYRVKIDGQWFDVPETAVIRGPNYLGHAVVWIYKQPPDDPDADSNVEFPYIRCFLPGPAI